MRNPIEILLVDMYLLSQPESLGMKLTYSSPIKNDILSFTESFSLLYFLEDEEDYTKYLDEGYDLLFSLGHQVDFWSSKNVQYFAGLNLDTYIDLEADFMAADIPEVYVRFIFGGRFNLTIDN